MKKISIMIPCYNEVENVVPMAEAVANEMKTYLPTYDWELVFIDNFSTDGTRDKLTWICSQNRNVKAIFNAKNFGPYNSPYYGLLQTTGDCTVMICCDFQEPVELIHRCVAEWEKGYKIVAAIKTQSKENKVKRFLRTCYYKTIKKMSSVEQIEHFTGTGLYDKSFIDVLRKLDDPIPFIRGIVAELGPMRKDISYTQLKRLHGHTHNSWYDLYDAAMLSFTSYTKVGLRLSVFAGALLSLVCLIVALYYFVMKLLYWDLFPMGIAPMVIGVFFMGSVQLLFLGLLGEYVLSINTRVMHRPLVVEERRINFDTPAPQQGASRPHA